MFKNLYILFFRIRSYFFLKKSQKEFFYIEKFKKFVNLYDKNFLILQNYCFEISNKLSPNITFGKKILKSIIILYSKKKNS